MFKIVWVIFFKFDVELRSKVNDCKQWVLRILIVNVGNVIFCLQNSASCMPKSPHYYMIIIISNNSSKLTCFILLDCLMCLFQ